MTGIERHLSTPLARLTLRPLKAIQPTPLARLAYGSGRMQGSVQKGER